LPRWQDGSRRDGGNVEGLAERHEETQWRDGLSRGGVDWPFDRKADVGAKDESIELGEKSAQSDPDRLKRFEVGKPVEGIPGVVERDAGQLAGEDLYGS
jgi:hypothetical protein